ncbi:MAG TPA: hypothetical protein VIV11_06450 [Kofleriaceae bacterium]
MIKKLVGLAALGGFLYAHKRRGGQLTMDSFKQTARSLVSDAKMKAQDLKAQAEQKLNEKRVAGADDFASASKMADDATGYGTSGYGYGSDRDFTRR